MFSTGPSGAKMGILDDLNFTDEVERKVPSMLNRFETDPFNHTKKCLVTARGESDLGVDTILKTLSMLKGYLYISCGEAKVEHVKCRMTPKAKENIILGWRKANMFGKGTPFVPCFTEDLKPLPPDIKIDTLRGMDIEIIDPKEKENWAELFIEFQAVFKEKDL